MSSYPTFAEMVQVSIRILNDAFRIVPTAFKPSEITRIRALTTNIQTPDDLEYDYPGVTAVIAEAKQIANDRADFNVYSVRELLHDLPELDNHFIEEHTAAWMLIDMLKEAAADTMSERLFKKFISQSRDLETKNLPLVTWIRLLALWLERIASTPLGCLEFMLPDYMRKIAERRTAAASTEPAPVPSPDF